MKFLGKADKTVSRHEVIWCYRSLLGREPESEAAILQHLQAKNFKALVECFVESPEFAENRLVGNAEVSREDVIWCYRNLLRREPESEAAVLSHLQAKSFRALVDCFVQSSEYSGGKATDLH